MNVRFDKSKEKTSGILRFRVAFSAMLMAAILLQNTLFGSTMIAQTIERSGKSEKAAAAPQAAFTAGNLAVLRADASANNTTATILEISPTTISQPSPVQSFPISGIAPTPMRFSGSATSTGYMATTNDGTLLTFMGHNNANTASNANTLNPRAVGTLDGSGNFAIQTTYTGSSGDQTRGATSLNNTNWFIGDQGGIYTNGSTTPSPSGNIRSVKAFGGTVYAFTASTAAPSVSTVATPSGSTLVGLPGLANGIAANQDFYLISSGSNGATYDVLYILSATSNTAGTISKFSLVGGSWVSNGTHATGAGGFGIAAADSGAGAVIYITTGQGALTANSVVRLLDGAGHNATINVSSTATLYTAPAGTIMKGLAFAPTGGGPAAPEINVTGNGNTIADGDTFPSPTDFTDFGNVNVGNTFDRTFVIQNNGSAPLTGGPVTFSGTHAGEFSIQGTPPSFPIAQGGSANLTVRFTPGGSGPRTATVNIPNNDADEAAYDFAIQGTGLTSGPPAIAESTASPFVDLPTTGPGALSGVVGNVSDPGLSLGVDFTITDPDTAPGSLTVTASSINTAVVTNGNISITYTGGNVWNVKINPGGAGYSNITVTASDGGGSANYVINYAASLPANSNSSTHWHTGKADASTVIPVDSDHMFVADDEDQTIRLYNRNNSGMPVNSFTFTGNLGLTDFDGGIPREVDIEASAQVGSRIYWLASHSNSASGNQRANRSRLFATDVSGAGAASTLSYVGRFDNLKANLIAWDNSNGHGLGAGALGFQASTATGVIPEEEDGSGFNIEGLVMAPDNTTAYIAFRAPISPAASRTNGLVIPVTNFTSLVAGNPTATTATFGSPIFMNLGGRGIREIRKNASNEYLIVAGPAGSIGNFRFFSWNGNPATAPIGRTGTLAGLNPESIVDVPVGLNSFALAPVPVQIVSDNGDDIYYNDGIIAKELPNNQHKKFRSDIVTVGLEVTAASVTVGGRVLNAAQMPVAKARVSIALSSGEIRTVLTNQFGQYHFEEIPVGDTVVIEAVAKGYGFTPQVLFVVEDVIDMNLTAFP